MSDEKSGGIGWSPDYRSDRDWERRRKAREVLDASRGATVDYRDLAARLALDLDEALRGRPVRAGYADRALADLADARKAGLL